MESELKEIVFECIASKLNEMAFLRGRSNSAPLTTAILISNLDDQAQLMGYKGSLTDLVHFADNMDISNTEGQFEEAVISPMKKIQGIYY